MDEYNLCGHIKKFDERRGRRFQRYMLSVDTYHMSTFIWVYDLLQACRLCATAEYSGVAQFVRLSEFPDADTEKVIFSSAYGVVNDPDPYIAKLIDDKRQRGIARDATARPLADAQLSTLSTSLR
jgi:hypothetical protein